MRYDVRTISDGGLPAGHDWALVEHGGGMTLFVKESHSHDAGVHAEAWAAFRRLDRHHTPCRQEPVPIHGSPLLRLA